MPRRILAAVAVPLVLAACNATSPIRPDLLITTSSLTAYALSGTSATLPSGLAVTYGTTVRVDGSASFDVAFDFDSTGAIRVSPVRVLVSPLTGAPQVGLLQVSTPFDSLKVAPNAYYRPDTAIVVHPGQTFVILTTRSTASTPCYYVSVPHIYAKVVVDSAFPNTTRAIYLRSTVDPNCGYRSFADGTYPTF